MFTTMKSLFTLIVSLFLAATAPLMAENATQAPVDPSQTGKIIVHVTELRSLDGMLGASLYASKKGFPIPLISRTPHSLKKSPAPKILLSLKTFPTAPTP